MQMHRKIKDKKDVNTKKDLKLCFAEQRIDVKT